MNGRIVLIVDDDSPVTPKELASIGGVVNGFRDYPSVFEVVFEAKTGKGLVYKMERIVNLLKSKFGDGFCFSQ